MDWWEISVTLSPVLAEAVSEIFLLYVPQGVVVDLGDREPGTPATVRAYLLVDEGTLTDKRELLASLRRFSQAYLTPAPVVTVIQDQDWTADWRETIPVLHLGQRIAIKPSWRSYRSAADEIMLEVDPGAAFGTGMHPTTQLCVEVLERRLKPDMRVLDLGTGTGILALVAAKLGAADVLALDCDPNAVTVARRNAEVNDVAHIVRAYLGSLPEVQGTYDIVLVNIFASTIIQMLEFGLINHIRPHGICVASGILTEQTKAVSSAMNAQGMRLVALCEREGWAALVAEM